MFWSADEVGLVITIQGFREGVGRLIASVNDAEAHASQDQLAGALTCFTKPSGTK